MLCFGYNTFVQSPVAPVKAIVPNEAYNVFDFA